MIRTLFKSSILLGIALFFITAACEQEEPIPPKVDPVEEEEEEKENEKEGENNLVEGVDYFLPKIDLNNWKITLPIRKNGKLVEVKPPAILDYANNETLQPFMYNDSTDGALVFHTYPGETTPNSSYSRTELREQIEPGSNSVNWTFEEGGNMKGRLKLDTISKATDGKFHRTMVMQIHGRLTNAQRDLIGEDDNNAPPMLKILWDKGKIRVKTKELKDVNVNDVDILKTSAWTDDEGRNFKELVNFDEFTLEVKAEEGRMQVILNGDETFTYEGIHMEKWGVFENYFKAGNYLQTRDEGAFATVKYYELEVSH
ncbi:MAG: polysaccharide lyase family 7 protein [Bacteroidota bacterium]